MTVLLDTNVISEVMRKLPDAHVLRWLDALRPSDAFVCAITVAEIAMGLALLPQGKRRQELTLMANQLFQIDFAGRCLAFDQTAAAHYGEIRAKRRRLGAPISVEDAQIACIALAGGHQLATRNVLDFAGIAGLQVVDPWME